MAPRRFENFDNLRLRVTSELGLDVLACVRTGQGFLASVHAAAPSRIHSHRVAVLNPAGNGNHVSILRVVNPKAHAANVVLKGLDGDGESPGSEVRFTVAPNAARSFTAQALESGDADFDGAIGNGSGKWQLIVEGDRSIIAMSLLESPSGPLANLSTAPACGVGPHQGR